MLQNTQLQNSTVPATVQAPQGARVYTCHISHRAVEKSPVLTVFADIVKVYIPQAAQVGGGERGKIRGFSKQSRKRFLESMASARNLSAGIFATLTYPAEFPDQPEIYHRHLDTLLKRLKRWEPNIFGWWRLEFQQRGAPHFHLLLFGNRNNVRRMRRWLKVAWFQVVGTTDLRHLAAGTQADLIESRRHAMAYASKYAAKLPDEPEQSIDTETGEIIGESAAPYTGRIWGTFGSPDQKPIDTVFLTPYQVIQLKRTLVRWLHSKASSFERRLARSSAFMGFSVFGAGDQSDQQWITVTQSTVYRMVDDLSPG